MPLFLINDAALIGDLISVCAWRSSGLRPSDNIADTPLVGVAIDVSYLPPSRRLYTTVYRFRIPLSIQRERWGRDAGKAQHAPYGRRDCGGFWPLGPVGIRRNLDQRSNQP